MLISSQVLDDLITDLETAIARTQGIPNSDKWLGYAAARAMVDAKRRELTKGARLDILAGAFRQEGRAAQVK